MPLRWLQDGPDQWRGLEAGSSETVATLYQPRDSTAWRVRVEGWPFLPGSFETLSEAQVAVENGAAQLRNEYGAEPHTHHQLSCVPETHSPIVEGLKGTARGRSKLDQAERHVQEAEERLARQQRTVTELELKGDVQEAEVAREFLATCRRSLKARRVRLRWERRKRGLEP